MPLYPCSTLRRVEPYATSSGSRLRSARRACSTLRRVEPYATLQRHVDTHASLDDLQYPQTGRTLCNYAPGDILFYTAHHLQYPQTGRTLCNLPWDERREQRAKLAVPSDGSNPMQPFPHLVEECSSDHLAVPSDGSNPMQRSRR